MATPINPLYSEMVKVPFAYRRDISWDLSLNELGDLKMVEDVDAVNQSIYAILSSNFGDKPLEEFFGANVAPLLFENASPPQFLQFEINSRLATAINKDEPSVIVLKSLVDTTNIDRNIIRVVIVYALTDGITVGVFDENLSIIK